MLVSHNMFAIKATCTRALFLSKGQLVYDGTPDEAIRLYEKESRLDTMPWAQKRVGNDPTQQPIWVEEVEILDDDGRRRGVFDHCERMRIRLHYRARQKLEDVNFVVTFTRSDGVSCSNHTTALDGFPLPQLNGRGVLEVRTPPLRLVAESYTLGVLIWDKTFQHLHNAQTAGTFHVRDEVLNTHFGVYHEPAEWRFVPSETAQIPIE